MGEEYDEVTSLKMKKKSDLRLAESQYASQ